MSEMFSSCTKLEELNVSNFNTSKVKNMTWMFYNCKSLKKLNLASFDTSNVESMGSMFEWCESLTELDISNFNTSKVKETSGMFSCCLNITNIYISNKWNTSSVTSSRSMFFRCPKLPNYNPNYNMFSDYYKVEYAYAGDGGYLSLKV
jgi:surface protein